MGSQYDGMVGRRPNVEIRDRAALEEVGHWGSLVLGSSMLILS